MSKPWYTKKWGKDKICGITLSRLRPGKNKDGLSHCVYLSCGHGFYRKPLLISLLQDGRCPLCREYIRGKDLKVVGLIS